MAIQINLNQQKNRKYKVSVLTIALIVVIVGGLLWGGLDYNKRYNTPSLTGKWISQETGKEVGFTEDGDVMVEGVKTGAYIIKAPDVIIYDIEGHTFEMNYKIKQRSLVWGLSGEEEHFERKGL